MHKLCPDCCMDYPTDKDHLRCCLDHMTEPEEIEEYAWNLWDEVQAYKAGIKTLRAENARLTLEVQKQLEERVAFLKDMETLTKALG